jgi:2-polyprenyl-3-methyl-5-hydroxy-6-metoxy-1,4-benzoquinol methylase
MSGIYNLLTEVSEMGGYPAEYWDKMFHDVPTTDVKNRAEYLANEARGKTILDIGGTGPMAKRLRAVAEKYYSVDKIHSNQEGHFEVDLDAYGWEAGVLPEAEIIIAGEVLEHLSNPGHFLDNVWVLGKPVIITVPNATSRVYDQARGKEVVNKEHVSWYSYHTLKVLVERHNFKIKEWFWYNGKPYIAEGLIFHLEPN